MEEVPVHDETAFYAALGEMLIKWNHAESLLRFMVVWLYELGDKGDILTAHMGSRTLSDAMNTLAEEYSDDILRLHLKHFVSYLDTLRGYRNYYAHGIAIVGFNEKGEPVGTLQETQARGSLTLTQELVSIEKIEAVTVMCQTAAAYGSAIISEMIHRKKLSTAYLGPPLASRQKPPLPDQLKKPRTSLRELRSRHQSSQD